MVDSVTVSIAKIFNATFHTKKFTELTVEHRTYRESFGTCNFVATTSAPTNSTPIPTPNYCNFSLLARSSPSPLLIQRRIPVGKRYYPCWHTTTPISSSSLGYCLPCKDQINPQLLNWYPRPQGYDTLISAATQRHTAVNMELMQLPFEWH